MPESVTGMYTGRVLYLTGPLEIPPGASVRVLVVPDPDYADQQPDAAAVRTELPDPERRFWSTVLARDPSIPAG